MIQVLQVLSCFLTAVGIFFILIDLRTKFDASFRYFGIALVILSLMTSIDLWITPVITDMKSIVFWTKWQHVLACAYIAFSTRYTLMMCGFHGSRHTLIVSVICAIFAPLFLTNIFITLKNGELYTTSIYLALFLPFAVYYGISLNYFIIRKLNRLAGPEKTVLKFHLVGFLLLFGCGILDITTMTHDLWAFMPSYTVIGALGYGIMASMIFIERFLMVLKEKQVVFKDLQGAYKDLEQANALKQIGESTAIMNHELRNYMFMISGNAQLLEIGETLSERGKELVVSINKAVNRMSHFTQDILELSKTQILKERHPICITEMLRDLVDRNFSRNKSNFILEGFDQKFFIHGEWVKIEQAFINLIKNALESATADEPLEIKLGISQDEGVLLVSIEDNGVGCSEAELYNIFNAFYTTKKSSGGTGLGLSIARNIVEIHGGKISIYSKNIGRKKNHGLIVNVTIPVYKAELEKRQQVKHPVVLITKEMENLNHVVRIFQNVMVNPHIVQTLDDMVFVPGNAKNMAVLVSTKALGENYSSFSDYPHLVLLSQHKQNAYALENKSDAVPVIFSEEYLLKELLPRVSGPTGASRKSSTTKLKVIS